MPSFFAIAALAAWLFPPPPATAAGIEFQFDTLFGANSVAPGGPAPWLKATFVNSPGGVLMSLSNGSLAASEKTDVVAFNLNPNLAPASLTFSLQSSVGSFTPPTISTGADTFRADGDGSYDIELDFAIGGGPSSWFGNGESATWLVGGISGLTAEAFADLSAPGGGAGPFYAAAHIQGTGGGSSSAWVEPASGPVAFPIPEPTVCGLMSVAAGTWLAGCYAGRKGRGEHAASPP